LKSIFCDVSMLDIMIGLRIWEAESIFGPIIEIIMNYLQRTAAIIRITRKATLRIVGFLEFVCCPVLFRKLGLLLSSVQWERHLLCWVP
jgi:hypothetical protein